jgi:hypothetical protein
MKNEKKKTNKERELKTRLHRVTYICLVNTIYMVHILEGATTFHTNHYRINLCCFR